jgi:hypothetical protein
MRLGSHLIAYDGRDGVPAKKCKIRGKERRAAKLIRTTAPG